jgi:hypothetical protein
MAREKATITVDRSKLQLVRTLTGASSASQAIDIALGELIRLDRLRQDIAAYTAQPPVGDEIGLTVRPPDWSDLADDTDWDAVYSDECT